MTGRKRSFEETCRNDLPVYVVRRDGGYFKKYTPANAHYPIRIYADGTVFDDIYSTEESRNTFDKEVMFDIKSMLEMNVEEGGTS